MPAARFWRVVGVETYAGGDLELSELHLYGTSGRLDATATVTSTHTPTAGTLAALQDDNLATTCRFAGAAVRAGGFAIAWDFGVGNTSDVLGLRIGAATNQAEFMSSCTLQYLDSGLWVSLSSFGRFPWPGSSAMGQAPSSVSINIPQATLFLSGAGDFLDSSPVGRPITPSGGVSISSVQELYGQESMLFDGIDGRLTSPPSPSLAFSENEDFAISFNAWKSENGSQGYDGVISTTTNGSATDGWGVELSTFRGLAFITQGAVVFSVGANPNTSRWENWEISRKNGVLRAFRHGQKIHESSNTRAYAQAGLCVGSAFPGGYCFKGFLQQVLIVKGAALHDEEFVPQSLTEVLSQPFEGLPLRSAFCPTKVSASATVPAFSTRRATPLQLARDVEHGGPGTIYGTTKTKGTPNLPTKARVVLLHQRSKLPVRETWSDPVTGAFAFTGIDTNQRFLTLAEDAEGHFRPVAANRLTPEVP